MKRSLVYKGYFPIHEVHTSSVLVIFFIPFFCCLALLSSYITIPYVPFRDVSFYIFLGIVSRGILYFDIAKMLIKIYLLGSS